MSQSIIAFYFEWNGIYYNNNNKKSKILQSLMVRPFGYLGEVCINNNKKN